MAISSNISDPTPAAIAKAARLLREGKLVAFPTETVYGLGADATQRGCGRLDLRGERATAV